MLPLAQPLIYLVYFTMLYVVMMAVMGSACSSHYWILCIHIDLTSILNMLLG